MNNSKLKSILNKDISSIQDNEPSKLTIDKLASDFNSIIEYFDSFDDSMLSGDIKLIKKVRKTLEVLGFHCNYSLNNPRTIYVDTIDLDKNVSLKVEINYADNGKLLFSASYPFTVQFSSLSIVALYISEFNGAINGNCANLRLDVDYGDIRSEYSYFVDDEHFNSEYFINTFEEFLKVSQRPYSKLHEYSCGKISKYDKDIYLIMLLESLCVVRGREQDEDDVRYGATSATLNFHTSMHIVNEFKLDSKSGTEIEDTSPLDVLINKLIHDVNNDEQIK